MKQKQYAIIEIRYEEQIHGIQTYSYLLVCINKKKWWMLEFSQRHLEEIKTMLHQAGYEEIKKGGLSLEILKTITGRKGDAKNAIKTLKEFLTEEAIQEQSKNKKRIIN